LFSETRMPWYTMLFVWRLLFCDSEYIELVKSKYALDSGGAGEASTHVRQDIVLGSLTSDL